MFYVYIIYSQSLNKYYVGSTQNLDQRLQDHNNSRSKFTKAGKPWTLKYHNDYETRSEAVKAEMKIKKMKSRKYIESLIENFRH
ncbi:GIY-YIG nuclease family protein [Reichenbachiella sp.]|uniref:GIY-YIG nuclease family protein n=1 Tax=Reichenbachiella sp. TaxID=2184521 RepID=UPI003B5AD103